MAASLRTASTDCTAWSFFSAFTLRVRDTVQNACVFLTSPPVNPGVAAGGARQSAA